MKKLSRYFRRIRRIMKIIMNLRKNSEVVNIKIENQILNAILLNYILKGLFVQEFSVRLPRETKIDSHGNKRKVINSWEWLFECLAKKCGFVIKDDCLTVTITQYKLTYDQ